MRQIVVTLLSLVVSAGVAAALVAGLLDGFQTYPAGLLAAFIAGAVVGLPVYAIARGRGRAGWMMAGIAGLLAAVGLILVTLAWVGDVAPFMARADRLAVLVLAGSWAAWCVTHWPPAAWVRRARKAGRPQARWTGFGSPSSGSRRRSPSVRRS